MADMLRPAPIRKVFSCHGIYQSVYHALSRSVCPISEDEMIYLDGGDAISPQQFTFNLVTNLIRLMGQAAFSGALNGLSNMRNDGLTTGGAIAHYWNRQNTVGQGGDRRFTGFAGYRYTSTASPS